MTGSLESFIAKTLEANSPSYRCFCLPQNSEYSGPLEKPKELLDQFHYEKLPFYSEEKSAKQRGNLLVKRIEIRERSPNSADSEKIEAVYFELAGKKRPCILIFPMLSGYSRVEESFASHFAEQGFSSLIVERKGDIEDNIDNLNSWFKEMILDGMKAIDWLETRERIDCSKLGILGASMGALRASMVASLESRVKAALLGLSGGDLPYIISLTDERGIAKRRKRCIKERKISIEKFYLMLKEKITHDPLNYAQYLDSRKTGMVLALKDSIIPIEKGLELRDRIGNPETIFIPASHYGSGMYIPYLIERAGEFFKRKFDL